MERLQRVLSVFLSSQLSFLFYFDEFHTSCVVAHWSVGKMPFLYIASVYFSSPRCRHIVVFVRKLLDFFALASVIQTYIHFWLHFAPS